MVCTYVNHVPRRGRDPAAHLLRLLPPHPKRMNGCFHKILSCCWWSRATDHPFFHILHRKITFHCTMQAELSPFRASFPSTGRLDDLCASTADLRPPSKPIRQITGEYKRSCANAIDSSSTPSGESKCAHCSLISGDWVAYSPRKAPSNRFSSAFIRNGVLSPRGLNQVFSPLISKPPLYSPNNFLGSKSKKGKSLLDDDERDVLVQARILFTGVDGDISDLEDDLMKDHDDTNRWKHFSSGYIDRISSSEHSMPSKPQRRASLLQTVRKC